MSALPRPLSLRSLAGFAAAAVVATAAACADPSSPDATLSAAARTSANVNAPGQDNAAINRDLARLRAGIGQLHNASYATNPALGGYDFLFPGPGGVTCFQSNSGAMGRHYVNGALVGDGVIDAARPEAIMFEPGPGGQLVAVGVEYVMPKLIDDEPQPRPTLYGRLFDDGGALWTLHVWAFRDNPTGMFTPWNPRVSCEFDAGKVGNAHH